MTVYEAIMKAADYIEEFPAEFDFMTTAATHCGTPGCALGWIGVFLGRQRFTATADLGNVADFLMNAESQGRSEMTFYDRMAALNEPLWGHDYHHNNWQNNAGPCAATLRLYAAKYHAPASTGIPESVRQIFTGDVTCSS